VGQLWNENFRIKNRKPSGTPMAKTVLIVDDNAFVRRALRKLLIRELRVEVREAQNGKEAIDKAGELQPDLIVLDVSMPLMNGLEAARGIKGLLPAMPIILYSAFCNGFAKDEARSLGISELVPKSEHASVLIQKVRGLLYPTAA
jgi:two-component system chemotaxis response regulator CheY